MVRLLLTCEAGIIHLTLPAFKFRAVHPVLFSDVSKSHFSYTGGSLSWEVHRAEGEAHVPVRFGGILDERRARARGARFREVGSWWLLTAGTTRPKHRAVWLLRLRDAAGGGILR